MSRPEAEELGLVLQSAARFAREVLAGQRASGRTPCRAVAEAARLGLLHAPLAPERGGAGLGLLGQTRLVALLAETAPGFAAALAAHLSALAALEPCGGDALDRALRLPGGRASLLALVLPPVACGAAPLCVPAPEVCRRLVRLEGGGAPGDLVELHEGASAAFAPVFGEAAGAPDGLEAARLAEPGRSLGAWRVAAGLASRVRARFELLVAAAQAGNAAAALRAAVGYAGERRQTGRVLVEHQEVRAALVRMEVRLAGVTSLVECAAGAGEQALTGALPVARQARLLAAELC